MIELRYNIINQRSTLLNSENLELAMLKKEETAHLTQMISLAGSRVYILGSFD